MSFARQLLVEIRAHMVTANLGVRAIVADNLVFMYHLIVASENMLLAAAEHTTPSKYREYLIAHYVEEKDHAKWLRADLQAAGVCVHNAPLMFDAAALAGSQYYLALHTSPYALLGYMMALECTPMDLGTLAALEKQHGPAMFRTLRHHVENDPGHGEDVLQQVDNMPPVYRELVRENALRTVKSIARTSRAFGSFPALPAHA